MEIKDLYKDTIKHIRVIRNVARGHKAALGIDEIDKMAMTPYERGRMGRSCERVARNLLDLYGEHQQPAMFYFLALYVEGIANPSAFISKGFSRWTEVSKFANFLVSGQLVDMSHFEVAVGHIAAMIDEPLKDVPRRMMLLKLSVA